MKIECDCGELIFDGTDDLPQKGHLIPDQLWFATAEAIDDRVIAPLVGGQGTADQARALARHLLTRSTRLMYQCRWCGRLYIDDDENNLHCYLPRDEATSREILRGRPGP